MSTKNCSRRLIRELQRWDTPRKNCKVSPSRWEVLGGASPCPRQNITFVDGDATRWRVTCNSKCGNCRLSIAGGCYCILLPYHGKIIEFQIDFDTSYPFYLKKTQIVVLLTDHGEDRILRVPLSPFLDTKGQMCICPWSTDWNPTQGTKFLIGNLLETFLEPIDCICDVQGKPVFLPDSTREECLARCVVNHLCIAVTLLLCIGSMTKRCEEKVVRRVLELGLPLKALIALVKSPRADGIFKLASQRRSLHLKNGTIVDTSKPREFGDAAADCKQIPMKVFVKTLCGKNISLQVRPMDLVGIVKLEIFEKGGWSRNSSCILIYKGKQLEDSMPLSAYGVREGTTLHLVQRWGHDTWPLSCGGCVMQAEVKAMMISDWHGFCRLAR